MYFNLSNIQRKIANIPSLKNNKESIIKFFLYDNLINLGIKNFYTHDLYPSFFLSKNDIIDLFKLANNRFNLDFNLSDFYNGDNKLISIDDTNVNKFIVSNIDELNLINQKHMETSTYGINQQSQELLKNIKKQQKLVILEEQIKIKKENDFKIFDNMTNLNRNFSNKKILALDFEFFIKKDYHIISELGISILENNQVISYHYLIDGNYQLKKNKSLQNKFDFGETKIINENDLINTIYHHLKNVDFLLLHEQREEIAILKELKINNISAQILDTQLMYKRYFKSKGNNDGKSLEELLAVNKVNYKHLHNAGNDAYYTLQLMLNFKKNLALKQNNKTINLKH